MFTTIARIITAVAAVAALSAVTTPSASAGGDLPSGSGTVSNSVQLTGTYEGTGVMGGFFNRERITKRGPVLQSTLFEIGDGYQEIAHVRLCAGSNYMFDVQAGVISRRDDGAVQVGAVILTWNDCFARTRGPSRHANTYAWTRELAWVAPGESVTLDLFVNGGNASNGATTFSATFTNLWAPGFQVVDTVLPLTTITNQYNLDLGTTIQEIQETGASEPTVSNPENVDVPKLDPETSSPIPVEPIDVPVEPIDTPVTTIDTPIPVETIDVPVGTIDTPVEAPEPSGLQPIDIVNLVAPVFTFDTGISLSLEK